MFARVEIHQSHMDEIRTLAGAIMAATYNVNRAKETDKLFEPSDFVILSRSPHPPPGESALADKIESALSAAATAYNR